MDDSTFEESGEQPQVSQDQLGDPALVEGESVDHHSFRAPFRVALVLLALALLVGAVALLSSGPSDRPSTIDGATTTAPTSVAPPVPPTIPSPEPAAVEEAIAFERREAATGASAAFTSEYRYTLAFFLSEGSSETTEISGTATLVRSGTLSALTVTSGGSLTLWADSLNRAVFWCSDTECFDVRNVPFDGPTGPGSLWMQAGFLLSNLEPAMAADSNAQLSPANTEMIVVTESLDGQQVSCTQLSGVSAGEVLTAKRCWLDGQVVQLISKGQLVIRTSTAPATSPVVLPHKVA